MIELIYSSYTKSTGICSDTRSLAEGNLFFALKGPSFNANDFVLTALKQGAYACVADEDRDEFRNNDAIFIVDDGLHALQELALYHRKKLKIPVIGLTGSNGKTTTKELIQATLKTNYRTYATKGNLNNHIGVPLSILEIDKNNHEIAIIEMGANHQNEITQLCQIARPNFGALTNIGLAHLEGFGNEEGIYKGKKELFDFLKNTGGEAFVNSDDKKVLRASEGLDRVLYGTSESNHISGSVVPKSSRLKINWKKSGEGEEHFISTQLTGEYNFSNVLTSICIASYFGVSPDDIKRGIEDYRPENNRSQVEITSDNNEVILDCYNANPSSMRAALENLAHYPSEKPKVVILGDMLELGVESQKEHEKVVEELRSLDISKVYLVGPEFGKIDLTTISSTHREETQTLFDVLAKEKIKDAVILLKGSRKMKLEQLFELL